MPMNFSNAMSENAARWFIRLRSEMNDETLTSQFEVWLKENPAHQKEYESFAETMQHLNGNHNLEAIADALEQQRQIAKSQRKQKINNAAVKFVALIFIGVVSFVTLKQYQSWYVQPELQMATNTPVGKLTTQTLKDGSRVTLNANSQMLVTFYRHQRHVQLQRGEAIFEVSKDAQRPFIVETDTARVTVLGTHFAVNKLAHLVRVSVDYGRVKVESKYPQQSIIITDGQVVEIEPQQVPIMVNRNALDAFSFLQGKLVFAGANVEEIAETLSRYRTIPVMAQGHSTKNISAVINVKDAEQFLQGMPNIASVKVEQFPNKTVLLSTTN